VFKNINLGENHEQKMRFWTNFGQRKNPLGEALANAKCCILQKRRCKIVL